MLKLNMLEFDAFITMTMTRETVFHGNINERIKIDFMNTFLRFHE